MRSFFKSIGALLVGGLVGAIISSTALDAQRSIAGRLEAREFVLVNERNQTTARLGSSEEGGTIFQLMDNEEHPAVEVGTRENGGSQFITFLFKGRARMDLVSLPNGDTTLYLGDQHFEVRSMLGALKTDIVTDEPASTWGLVIRKPQSSQPAVQISTTYERSRQTVNSTLRLALPDGKSFTLPR